jgi:hypothetical protein
MMGGKSKSSSSQQTSNAQYSQVNDGDYAGASDFFVDESDNSIKDSYNQSYQYTDESDNSFTYTDESDNSMSVEDSFNTTNNYEDNSDNRVDNSQYFEDNSQIDNSQTFVDESVTDNSQYFEDNSDRSVDNSQYFEDNSDNSQTFVDESVTDNSQYFEDNRDLSQTFVDESDNSQYFEDNSDRSVDNSQYFEDNSDNRVDSRQYFEDNRDLSQTFVDESDNSIENTGEFAGVNGDISILDGGVIDEAFAFANNVNAEGNATAREAVNAITDTAINTTNIAANAITDAAMFSIESASDNAAYGIDKVSDTASESILSTERTAGNSLNAMFASLKESLGFGRDSISALQQQSDTYAAALSANVDEFSDTLENITTSAISNASSQVTASNQANAMQIETIAALAESSATGGASNFADSAASQVKYLAVAVAVGIAALALN